MSFCAILQYTSSATKFVRNHSVTTYMSTIVARSDSQGARHRRDLGMCELYVRSHSRSLGVAPFGKLRKSERNRKLFSDAFLTRICSFGAEYGSRLDSIL